MKAYSTLELGMMAIGKRVGQDLYVHLAAVEAALDWEKLELVRCVLVRIDEKDRLRPNVVKVGLDGKRVSLLHYPDFENSPFPELAASWSSGPKGQLTFRNYQDSLNPPLLHRKELLVPHDWPHRSKWAELTQLAESIGLFDDTQGIGFRMNWERLVASKGFQVVGETLEPLGNAVASTSEEAPDPVDMKVGAVEVQRHMTALSRTNFSAPIQLLLRSGLLSPEASLFDYGCGRGTDVEGLAAQGYNATGWDPHYAPLQERRVADVVNLGFVVNVIEDPSERVDAIRAAARLARRVLAVSVMLNNNQNAGTPYQDGFISTRKTFQKYFTQDELREYLEHVLDSTPVMAAPGIALHFTDKEWEQRYLSNRYQRQDLSRRLLDSVASRIAHRPALKRTVEPRISKEAQLLETCRPLLDRLWSRDLDLGRWAEPEEVDNLEEVNLALGSLARAQALLAKHYDQSLLERASQARSDDVLLYVASQLFKKRKPYNTFESKLRRDIKAFFGDYRSAQAAAASLLLETGKPEQILAACREASARGIGYLDNDHSLQFHASLVDRLPPVLRAYVACGLLLWDESSEVQLIKIHIESGKLTLLEYDEFETNPLPSLRRRVKVNLRRLDYDVFEYGSTQFPAPPLYHKSRYMSEEDPQYSQQVEFDEALEGAGVLADTEHGPSREPLMALLDLRRKQIVGMQLCPSDRIPDLDQPCGENFSYRDFIECGETQRATRLANVPLNPATYNALFRLASEILDPLIEYFGSIKLTYGFCSPALGKHIKGRVAPKLDQHAACETQGKGGAICDRLGAACDFLVEDESMREVADWIIEHLPFDRLYFYGDDRPLHVSVGPQEKREAYEMVLKSSGHTVPAKYRRTPKEDSETP